MCVHLHLLEWVQVMKEESRIKGCHEERDRRLIECDLIVEVDIGMGGRGNIWTGRQRCVRALGKRSDMNKASLKGPQGNPLLGSF